MALFNIKTGAQLSGVACALVLLGGIGVPTSVLVATSASAMGEAPQPVVDCRKRKNREKAECKPKPADGSGAMDAPALDDTAELSDDQIYAAAYALAKSDRFAEARALLLKAKDQSDPRILNYLGFTTRKLGDPTGALTFYRKALAAKPDYAVARAYYGEALVETGALAAARSELTRIEAICGTTCAAYVELSDRLKKAKG